VQKYVFHQNSQVVTMCGYENMLVVIYHGGLPIFDHQQLRCKIIDCGIKNQTPPSKLYSPIFEGECPSAEAAHLVWAGFSEEGMLSVLGSNGVLSGLNLNNNQWIPLLDLKNRQDQSYKQTWVVGIQNGELLSIQLPSGEDQPPVHLKHHIKVIKLEIPLIQAKPVKNSKEEPLTIMEEKVLREKILLEHEIFRKDLWEQHKHYRSDYESEKYISESILD
jgi:hypothetical protein